VRFTVGYSSQKFQGKMKNSICQEPFQSVLSKRDSALLQRKISFCHALDKPILIDRGLGNASSVARDVIGEKELVDFTVQESAFDRFSKKLGASVAEQLAMWMGFQGPTLR